MYKVFIIGVSKSSPKCLTFLTLTLDSDIYIVLAAFRIDQFLPSLPLLAAAASEC